MDVALANLMSPWWWLTVVVGSVALHILAIRVDHWAPVAWQRISLKWQKRTVARKQASATRINALSKNDYLLGDAYHREIAHRLAAVWRMVMALLTFAGGTAAYALARAKGEDLSSTYLMLACGAIGYLFSNVLALLAITEWARAEMFVRSCHLADGWGSLVVML